jgi:hypothetical protein
LYFDFENQQKKFFCIWVSHPNPIQKLIFFGLEPLKYVNFLKIRALLLKLSIFEKIKLFFKEYLFDLLNKNEGAKKENFSLNLL